MARDYKYAGKTSLSTKGAPGWLWFLGGLSVGLLATVLTYLSTQHPVTNSNKQRTDVALKMQSTRSIDVEKNRPKPVTPKKPVESAKKPPENTPPKPQFEFYTILPEREIQVPEYELRSQAQQQTPKQTREKTPVKEKIDTAKPDKYILQVGSFRHLGDADQLKAKLVINGFDVTIQNVLMSNGDTWYRVRLGPYQDPTVVNRIRAELQRNGFTPLVLKEKG